MLKSRDPIITRLSFFVINKIQDCIDDGFSHMNVILAACQMMTIHNSTHKQLLVCFVENLFRCYYS